VTKTAAYKEVRIFDKIVFLFVGERAVYQLDREMKKLLSLVIFSTIANLANGEETPSLTQVRKPFTTISSNRLEMIRNPEQNKFKFWGKIKFESKAFSGTCDEMVVYSLPQTQQGSSSKLG
jgi:hypothetical protein